MLHTPKESHKRVSYLVQQVGDFHVSNSMPQFHFTFKEVQRIPLACSRSTCHLWNLDQVLSSRVLAHGPFCISHVDVDLNCCLEFCGSGTSM